jgi:maltose alpha-D-glucosyltransferase / alpha-amylase
VATAFSHGRLSEQAQVVGGLPRAAKHPPWYKEAVIYQTHVRAFHDANRDGIGDFRGLTQKLGYVRDLGVTAIWLLPFFPSPLKDDGYDIADYTSVNPSYGTIDDFEEFLEEAHRRDLRVITELVMNHTSDQHAWFQASRAAPAGSPLRDWYVWSDTPEKYSEARIIFQDFETSNWTWDPVAGAYFWHRFYSHQPDLNFDNPEVRQAMLDTLDFWFNMGVDGLRLDAIPYLYEREGTNCENLPETHDFLKTVRAHIDGKFADKMLLAEANQWPEDAAAYFGDGDECHMNFHFPLMPRLFMAVEREDQSPIVDILEQTPLLPESCQWAIFLRNHDELTLEMVTDEERDYMYRTYAVDAKARINLGIRRRLAPLMGNDRRKVELMNALLLSLPGTPVLYYGDEIGMGDNYFLGDRNGVRTPMQWNGDRSAGFSRANPQSLYLPVIIDPQYHYELRNVEVEEANPQSLLWWTRRIIDVRKRFDAFGEGSFRSLHSENSKVFAFLRETEREKILVIANLSRFSQYVELDLSEFEGRTPIELFGRTSFPTIKEGLYPLTLGPYGFYWLCLDCGQNSTNDEKDLIPSIPLPLAFEDVYFGAERHDLENALEPYLYRQRWFGGKARTLQSIEIKDVFPLSDGASLNLLLVEARYAHGEPEGYVIPIAALNADDGERVLRDHPEAGIVRLNDETTGVALVLCGTSRREELWSALAETIQGSLRIAGRHGNLVGLRTGAFDELWDDSVLDAAPLIHGGEQSNTSARLGDRFVLKLFRRVTAGVNPDFELGQQLTNSSVRAPVARVAGAVEYRTAGGKPTTIAILHEYVENVSDAWTHALEEIGRYCERIQERLTELPRGGAEFTDSDDFLSELQSGVRAVEPIDDLVAATVGPYLSSAEQLGRRTAEMHLALVRDLSVDFEPEPFSKLYQRGLYQSFRSQARATLRFLHRQLDALPEEDRQLAVDLLGREQQILATFAGLLDQRLEAKRIRCHGDFHLGQVLFTGKDFVIIDFEGEPERPVSERRIKASPLRDIAGMLRSFHYAAHTAVREDGLIPRIASSVSPEFLAEYWTAHTSRTFLRSYLAAAGPGGFNPVEESQIRTLLKCYLMEKALYELRYELNNRPDWIKIPLNGIDQLLQ